MAAQSNELMLCEVWTSKKLREMSAEIPLEIHGIESLSLGFRKASQSFLFSSLLKPAYTSI